MVITKKELERLALSGYACPWCKSPAGSPCYFMASWRQRRRAPYPLSRPHKERTALASPVNSGSTSFDEMLAARRQLAT